MMENIRFYFEEEANDSEFAKKLSSFADIYETWVSSGILRSRCEFFGDMKSYRRRHFTSNEFILILFFL